MQLGTLLLLSIPVLLAIREQTIYWSSTPEERNARVIGPMEVIFLAGAPILGLFLLQIAPSELSPFARQYKITGEVWVVITTAGYWVARLANHHTTPIELVLLPIALLIGMALEVVLLLHMLGKPEFQFILEVSPFFGGVIIAPGVAFGFFLVQFHRLNQQRQSLLETMNPNELNRLQTWVYQSLQQSQSDVWKQLLFLPIMIIPIQLLLVFLEQPLDALVLTFTESEDFLFSIVSPQFTP